VRGDAERGASRSSTRRRSRCRRDGDVGRLQQIVRNLLSNGDQVHAGGGRVSVRVDRAGGPEARLVVATRRGQSPRVSWPHVFDRFRQADSSMTRVYGASACPG